MALAVTSTALASANGIALGPAFQVAQVHSKQLRVTSEGAADSANTQRDEQQQQQQSEGPAAAAGAAAAGEGQEPGACGGGGSGRGDGAGGPPSLPRRADVVLHEIFGTDPLSEHILPSMAHVQVGVGRGGGERGGNRRACVLRCSYKCPLDPCWSTSCHPSIAHAGGIVGSPWRVLRGS